LSINKSYFYKKEKVKGALIYADRRTDEWTDEHDEANRFFLQLGERAEK
jgi:hypothetical protein